MKESDLKIEAGFPGRNPGGQQVGIVTAVVRIEHIPTGIVATCKFERSQSKNKRICIAMIEYGLAELGWRDA